jgi:hypothetical protein
MPVSHFTWQVLRALVRKKNRPQTGRQLRLVPNTLTKDGTFFDGLVEKGLLEVVGVDQVTEETERRPAPFRTRYKLTEKGKFAAEYGECEQEVKRHSK